jgi:YcxB-like protein
VAGRTSYWPEVADYVAASRAAWWRGVKQRRFWTRNGILFVAIGILAAAAAFGLQWDDKLLFIASVLGGGIAGALICVGIGFVLLPRRATRLFRQQKTLHAEFVLDWTAQGARFVSPKGTSDLLWSDYLDWAENDAVFILTINDGLYHFVPKRVLDDLQTVDLRETLSVAFSH